MYGSEDTAIATLQQPSLIKQVVENARMTIVSDQAKERFEIN
jgi:hypothetical protein